MNPNQVNPNQEKVKRLIVTLLLEVAAQSDPEDFRAFFSGAIIGNVVGNLPDDYWRRFLKIEICDEPGCNCYELAQALVPVLDTIRDDHRKHLSEMARAKQRT